jgi:mRNA interferase RelE/StbE
MQEVRLSDHAKRDLSRLPRDQQAFVVAGIERYAKTGHDDLKKLRGRVDEWRLRVGDYRVIFTCVDGRLTILVLRVLPRKDAY